MPIRLDPTDVRERAYAACEPHGRPNGSDANWFEAEPQLKLELDAVSTPLEPLTEKAAEKLTEERPGHVRRARGRGRSSSSSHIPAT
jgi:Protein of unknown function (DUF2934)